MVAELIEQVKEQYDYVLFDTAPIGLVIDAAMLAPYCDGAIFLISVDETSAKFAIEAKEQLEKTGCHIIGVILNEAKQNQNSSFLNRKTKYYAHKPWFKRSEKSDTTTTVYVPTSIPAQPKADVPEAEDDDRH